MGDNQRRRQARRQPRGLQRVEEILDAAEWVFLDVGYDEATTIAIAARAAISPGSLYQFFPHKEAIARALAARYVVGLRAIHARELGPDAATLPLTTLLDHIVDPIVAFNRAHPALMALFGAHASPQLAGLLDELHAEVVARFEVVVAALPPRLDPDRRWRMAAVSVRLALALLPLTLDPDVARGDAMVGELKAALHGYLAPAWG